MTKYSNPLVAMFLAAPLLLAGCSNDGDTGSTGPPGPPGPGGGDDTSTDLGEDEDAPGVVLEVLGFKGATGAGGSFRPGDTFSVKFTVKKHDGTDWNLSEFSRGRILVSGPTSNYQRVLAEESDLMSEAVTNANGIHTYTFASKIPATYLPPLNDTPTFGADEGELTGQPLLPGTYTVGLYATWGYTVGNDSYTDVGNVTEDFLVKGATILEPRAVVGQENCNQCHDTLQAHGGMRRNVTLCLMCHTSGAEDKNELTAAGGTPDVTIDFKVMIHKLHNGAHLPSVNGIATNADGSRDYTAPPKPYEVVGYKNSVHDFSEVHFPAWPGAMVTMPRDQGYSALSSGEQGQENTVRTGISDCTVCHGDPDGSGPLTAPDDGQHAFEDPTRMVCGSCHDDIDWDLPYTANGQTMPQQATDDACTLCHEVSGSWLDVEDAHRHPLLDPAVNSGLNFTILDLLEAGTNDGDSTIDPGEKVAVTFTMTDDLGADVDPAVVSSISSVVSGPTSNYNVLLNTGIPTAALVGPQPFTINLPAKVQLEYVGDSTAGLDVFNTALTPHWILSGATTTVEVLDSMSGGDSTLAWDVPQTQNYVDVVDPTGFDRNQYLVISRGGAGVEYLKIQWVDGDRLWFSSPYSSSYAPGTLNSHLSGARVEGVSLITLTEGVEYSLNAAAGTITELIEFGAGDAVVVSYTSDFVMPASYPLALNSTPELDETWGSWTGKSLVDGTYSLGLWGYQSLSLPLFGETNSYRGAASATGYDFLVGSAASIDPYDLVSSAENCNDCHQDLYFHGASRRGFTACLMCHGTAGSGDRPRYVAANAPETEGVTINFRTMLHKIHMGAELANAATYEIVGYGSASKYPDNYSIHTYDELEFPNMPTHAQNCAACHGEDNDAWTLPKDRDHPFEQGALSREWRASCNSCHDSEAATAHIDIMTSTEGAESCAICHGDGEALNVELAHKVRR